MTALPVLPAPAQRDLGSCGRWVITTEHRDLARPIKIEVAGDGLPDSSCNIHRHRRRPRRLGQGRRASGVPGRHGARVARVTVSKYAFLPTHPSTFGTECAQCRRGEYSLSPFSGRIQPVILRWTKTVADPRCCATFLELLKFRVRSTCMHLHGTGVSSVSNVLAVPPLHGSAVLGSGRWSRSGNPVCRDAGGPALAVEDHCR